MDPPTAELLSASPGYWKARVKSYGRVYIIHCVQSQEYRVGPALLSRLGSVESIRIEKVFAMDVGGIQCICHDDTAQHSTILANMGTIDCQLAVSVAKDVLVALRVLHGNRIVHKFVTPNNILVPKSGGPAKLVAPTGGELTDGDGRAWERRGRIPYSAPEVVAGLDGFDSKCDIWSLGVTLFASVTGGVPFAEGNPYEFIADVVQNGVVFPESAAVSEGLKAAIVAMLTPLSETRPGVEECICVLSELGN